MLKLLISECLRNIRLRLRIPRENFGIFEMGSTNALFRDLRADDPEPEITTIESFCVHCHENGVTRLLLTKIPFYKDVILMSFDCQYCGFQNNEIQSGGKVEEKGMRIVLKVENEDDLNRTLVKSDFTCIKIPELDFEIPPNSQKGEVTTVEGVIDRVIAGLRQDQETRLREHPDVAAQIEEFISKLAKLKTIATPFTMVIEDISGNCFLSNPRAPETDPRANITLFARNKDQDHLLGIYSPEELHDEEEGQTHDVLGPPQENFAYEDLLSEVFQLPANCPACNVPCKVNTKMTKIPYFKEVLIMATNCDSCGYRTNEVKSGCGIEPQGIRIEITVTSEDDLNRDILKSDTCELKIPELDLEVGPATLGGRFSTVEGLLRNIKEQLQTQGAMFSDSAEEKTKLRFDKFFEKLDSCIACQMSFTMILDDPAGNSYVQSKTPPMPDEKLQVRHYERTFEQNEHLGINDMVVDNY